MGTAMMKLLPAGKRPWPLPTTHTFCSPSGYTLGAQYRLLNCQKYTVEYAYQAGPLVHTEARRQMVIQMF